MEQITKLLVINFLIKLYALRNIFEAICGKYGQSTLTISRNMERSRIKIAKLKCDLKFLLTCKKHNLCPTFARPKISVKLEKRIRKKITKTIIEAEITNKHKRLKELKKKEKGELKALEEKLGFVLLCALNKAINRRIKGKRQEWSRIHERKLSSLFKEIVPLTVRDRPNNVVHKSSSYRLTAEEYHILSYGLDHHIPSRLSENEIKTEFEVLFYTLNKQLGHLNSDEKDELKSKLRFQDPR